MNKKELAARGISKPGGKTSRSYRKREARRDSNAHISSNLVHNGGFGKKSQVGRVRVFR